MTQNDLKTRIKAAEADLLAAAAKFAANKHLMKQQLTNPIIMPALLVTSVIAGVIMVKKKRHNHIFAYLTSLTLAANSIYKKFNLVMNMIEQAKKNHPMKK